MAASLHQDLLGLHDKGPAVAHRDCSAYWRHNEVLRHEEAPVIGRDVLDAADDVGEDILLPVVVEAVVVAQVPPNAVLGLTLLGVPAVLLA